MSDAQHSRTHLFMVRVWLEDLGDGKIEWRGQVKQVLGGEVRYFRDWSNMVMILQEMLAEPEEAAKDAGSTSPAVIIPENGRNPGDG